MNFGWTCLDNKSIESLDSKTGGYSFKWPKNCSSRVGSNSFHGRELPSYWRCHFGDLDDLHGIWSLVRDLRLGFMRLFLSLKFNHLETKKRPSQTPLEIVLSGCPNLIPGLPAQSCGHIERSQMHSKVSICLFDPPCADALSVLSLKTTNSKQTLDLLK